MPVLFIAFIALPLVEIALFITVGRAIGLLPTLTIIIGTGVFGVALLRRQQVRAMTQLRQTLAGLGDPRAPLAAGAFTMLAGLLLILPGFLTDTIGLLLLLPPVQALLLSRMSRRVTRSFRPAAPHRYGAGAVVIDGDYVERDEPRATPRPDSPWADR